ncbi:MAG: hypothetical protein IJ678_08490, partial [Kiritimatiellae bacterium]|nr:hypothetical protein [Kiritimatiellia bacterium]
MQRAGGDRGGEKSAGIRERVSALLRGFDPDALPPGSEVLQSGRNLTVRVPLPGGAPGEDPVKVVVKRVPAPNAFRAAA